MSQKLVSHSPDLSRLREDGYDIAIGKSGQLLIREVPYVNCNKEVKCGILLSELNVAGGATVPPETHVAFFVGDYPCNPDGTALPGVSANVNQSFGEGLSPNHSLSRKPSSGRYRDYYEKMRTYIDIICSPAQAIDPTVTARTHPVVIPEEGESVFHYLDTASTKAGIVAANSKLESGKVAIVGVGGSGAYVLDLVAKTPVQEIHLFDRDLFLNHNAFRCPGAASIDDLSTKQEKVAYLAQVYSRMRRMIIPHNCFVDEGSVDQLQGMTFVFVCIDKGGAKRLIVERLEAWGIPFIDVGMGVQLTDDNSLRGILTITTSTATKRDHLRGRVALADGEGENEYSRNIQIADLNALNAALAVIKWKKLCGYYQDLDKEHFSTFTINGNQLLNEDKHEV